MKQKKKKADDAITSEDGAFGPDLFGLPLGDDDDDEEDQENGDVIERSGKEGSEKEASATKDVVNLLHYGPEQPSTGT